MGGLIPHCEKVRRRPALHGGRAAKIMKDADGMGAIIKDRGLPGCPMHDAPWDSSHVLAWDGWSNGSVLSQRVIGFPTRGRGGIPFFSPGLFLFPSCIRPRKDAGEMV